MDTSSRLSGDTVQLTELILERISLACRGIELDAKAEVLEKLRTTVHPVLAKHWCVQADELFECYEDRVHAERFALVQQISCLSARIEDGWRRLNKR